MSYSIEKLLFVPFMSSIPVGFFSKIICINRLKNRHHKIWNTLGRPTVLREKPKFFIPSFKFYFFGGFTKLADPVLSFFSWMQITSSVTGAGIFILFAVDKYAHLHLFTWPIE